MARLPRRYELRDVAFICWAPPSEVLAPIPRVRLVAEILAQELRRAH